MKSCRLERPCCRAAAWALCGVALGWLPAARAGAQETPQTYEQRIRELEERIKALESKQTDAPKEAPKTDEEKPASGEPSLDAIFAEAGAGSAAASPSGAGEAQGSEKTIDAITREAGESEGAKFPWFPAIFNPQIGVMIETLGRFGTQDDAYDTMNTIDMRELELNLYGNFDPVGKAFALISGSDDVSVEQAYFLFTGLPYDIQLRAGKMFTNTSYLNKVHTHDLPFVDQPLAMQNFMGTPDSLDHTDPATDSALLLYEPIYDTVGGELSWLVPTPWYWKVQAAIYEDFSDRSDGSFWDQYVDPGGVIDTDGKSRGYRDFTYGAGTSLFFELGEDHSVKLSGNFLYDGPDDDLQRTLENAAVSYSWYPLEGGLYHNLRWVAEAYANQERFLRNVSGVPNADTWGVYSYVSTQLGRRFSVGVLGEWSQFRFDEGADGWHAGAFLTYFISERQRVRFQVDRIAIQEWYTSTAERTGLDRGDGDYWQFALQWVVVLGAHMHTYE